MRRVLLFLILCTIWLGLAAQQGTHVTMEQAKEVGYTFLRGGQSASPTRGGGVSRDAMQLVYTGRAVDSTTRGTTDCYYVFSLQPKGFVIVAADERVEPVLGYSYDNDFAVEDMPEHVRGWLGNYEQQIKAAIDQNLAPDSEITAKWTRLERGQPLSNTRSGETVGPLLTTTWNQAPYYNALCPADANGPDGHVVTGCVATAMAQIINYWGYPAHGRGTHSYESDYGTLEVNYDSARYDYANMPDALTNTSTPEQVNAVATLMRDCGVAVNMMYSADGSGAYDRDARAALINFFRFSSNLSYIERELFKINDEWHVLLRKELDSNRPIIYSGFRHLIGGHTFVCDGYNSDNYYHFNFGWSGNSDGWYLTSAVIGYIINQSAIIGIVPDSMSNVILGQTSGTSTFMVNEPLEFYHLMGHNPYNGTSYNDPCSNTVTFVSADDEQVLVADIMEFEQQALSIYDGNETSTPLRFLTTEGNNDLEPLVSSQQTMTFVYSGNFNYNGFKLMISQNSDCRMVSNIVSVIDTTTVHLSWTENSDASQWQIEYGTKGFPIGEGTQIVVGINNATIHNLEAYSEYDFYIRSVCGENQYGLWNKSSLIIEGRPSDFRLSYNIIEGGVEVTYRQPELNIPAYPCYPDTIVIPRQVTIDGTTYPVIAIGDLAFRCCWNLKAVVMPNTITKIGEYAFFSDYSITQIDMPDSVVEIKRCAFLGVQITHIDLPNTLTHIGIQAFSFTPLSSITIPPSLTTIGSAMCFTFDARYYILVGGEDLSLPFSATAVLDTLCFDFATTLDTINWNADSCMLEYFNENSFEAPFRGHRSIVNIGNNVRVIPELCFWSAYKDSILTISENVTYIGFDAFSESTNLKIVNFNAKNCYAPDLLTWCVNVETINFGDSVKKIPDAICSNNTEGRFGLDHLTTINFGNSIDTIGASAFAFCNHITSITLPSSVKHIAVGAFIFCSDLSTVNISSPTPPSLEETVFRHQAEDRIFVIPCEYYDAYMNAETWIDSFPDWDYELNELVDFCEDYRNRIRTYPSSTYHLTLETNDSTMGNVLLYKNASACNSTTIYYAEANSGYLFDHWSNGSTQNPDTLLLTNDTTITAFFTTKRYLIDGISAIACLHTTFEDPEQDTLWTFKNGDYVNKWYINTIDDTNRAMFISSDNGLTNKYSCADTTDFSYVFAYRPMYLKEGEYLCSYDWRVFGFGEPDKVNLWWNMPRGDHLFTFFYEGNVDDIPLAYDTSYLHYLPCTCSDCCMGYTWDNFLSNSLYINVYGQTWGWRSQSFNVRLPNDGNYNLLYYWRNGCTWEHACYLVGPDGNGYPAAIDNVLLGRLDTTCGYVAGTALIGSFDTVTLTAVPNYGYHFVCWQDFDTNIVKNVVATDNITCVAYFENNEYNVTVHSSDTSLGRVRGGGTFQYLSECTISATPMEGYYFTQWSDGNNENPRTLTVTKDTILSAYFDICTDTNWTFEASICQGESYNFNGIILSEQGTYFDTLQTVHGCDSVVTLHLTVNPIPEVSVSGNQHVCETEPVTLTANVGTGGMISEDLHYAWFVDGQLHDNMAYNLGDSNLFVEYFYPRDEPYRFSVQVSYGDDATCASLSGEYLVYVHPLPNVSVSASETSICVGGYTTIMAGVNNSNPDNILFSWSDGNFGSSNIFFPTSSGSFTFTVTATSGLSDCSSADEITIEVNDIPETPVITADNAMVFNGSQVTLSVANPIADAVYTWYRNGFLIEGAYQPTLIEFLNTFDDEPAIYNYQVVATLYNSGCVSEISDNTVVTVNPTPAAVVSVEGDTVLCEGDSTLLHVNVTPANIPYTYQWYLDDEPIPGATSVDYVVAESARMTPYNIYLVATANGDYSVMSNVTEILFVLPPSVSIQGSDNINYGQSTTLTASGADAYEWNTGEHTASITVAPTTATTYTVLGTSEYGCTATASVTVTVTLCNTSTYEFSITACDSYTWNNSVYTQSGDYSQTFTNILSCDSIVTLHLTVNPTHTVTDEMTIASTELPFEWNGVMFTEAGTQVATLQTIHGCDSLVTMTLTVTAVENYLITVNVSDETPWGTVTGSGSFAFGAIDTLTATAFENYIFAGWSDFNTESPRVITVTQDSNFTAFFIPDEIDEIELPVNDTIMGSVNLSFAGGGSANVNSMVVITAVPEPHYHFISWSDGNTDNPRTVSLMEALQLTAIFAIDQHTITVLSADESMGTVSVGGTYDYGMEISISADARENYRFVEWNDNNTENPRTITVEQDSTFIAFFEFMDGIDEFDESNILIYSNNNQIIIVNAEGLSIDIFDMSGRLIVCESRIPSSEHHYTIHTPGVYLVNVGKHVVRKVKIIAQ